MQANADSIRTVMSLWLKGYLSGVSNWQLINKTDIFAYCSWLEYKLPGNWRELEIQIRCSIAITRTNFIRVPVSVLKRRFIFMLLVLCLCLCLKCCGFCDVLNVLQRLWSCCAIYDYVLFLLVDNPLDKIRSLSFIQ